MSLDIQFAFVCRRKFAELTGDSEFKRFCETCKIVVINLDPLDDRARLQVFEEAAKTKVIPCISTTTQIQGSKACAGSGHPHFPPPSPTAGLPKLPENLEAERQRIERLRKEDVENNMNPRRERSSSLLSRFKFVIFFIQGIVTSSWLVLWQKKRE